MVGTPEVGAVEVPSQGFLIDVRENDEWQAGHAPQALHIPLGELAERSGEIPRDRTLYVVCRSGGRSARAVQALNGAGWQAINVSDGMQGWAAAGRGMQAETGAEPRVV
jgi:rhodanese-related sulfurtransferase